MSCKSFLNSNIHNHLPTAVFISIAANLGLHLEKFIKYGNSSTGFIHKIFPHAQSNYF